MALLARLVPSPRALFIFEAAARAGSFTAAAAEFNVTQPSVSRSIAQLEAALGLKLFTRGARGLTLTPEGAELHAAMREASARIGETIAALQARRRGPDKPVVTLSLSSSFVAHWLLPRLGAFNAAFPQVDLRFDLIAGVLHEVPPNIDLATRIVPQDDSRHHRWPFAPEVIVPVCSPAYLAARGRLDHDGDGAGHVFLHLSEHALPQWAKVWGEVANRGAARGIWHEFTDYAVILQAALSGEGIALGWLSVIASALLKGALVPASDRRVRTGHWHSLIAPRSRPLAPAVAEIAHWLQSRMTEELRQLEPILTT